ncbi:uncharacterized protein LOC144544851 [Carex rostrata]
MDSFNDLISSLQVIEIQLQNRQYTYCNKRPNPSFSKLDRIFVSTEVSLQFPLISLMALEMSVSDHTPLLLTCKHPQSVRKPLRLEKAWFRYPQMRSIIQRIWQQIETQSESRNDFQSRCNQMHNELRQWHLENFGKLTEQLSFCKKAVLFFDCIEEKRNLDVREFKLRLTLRERIFELANFEEIRWHQRSRCRWLQHGDRNTAYFHNFASSRARVNSVLQIHHQGQVITDEGQIRHLFFQGMQRVLGVPSQVQAFDARSLYTPQDLAHMQSPFTDIEIDRAIRGLASNKACGPDGLPNEFAKVFWQDIGGNITAMINQFYNHELDLTSINRANIIFIPKKECPKSTMDYRPISVINLFPKILSKILANRLAEVLLGLISFHQTAFVRGRFIAENFISTREILQHLSTGGREALFAKIDFAKAFDTLSWEFLREVMHSRGFPTKWIRWIMDILSTSSSRVVINGQHTIFFQHKRGLRQGDPLSPMLFILAVDVLQMMISNVNNTLTNPMSTKLHESMMALQYADDTAFVLKADVPTVVSFKILLRLFTKISGLEVNFSKSAIVPINLSPRKTEIMRQITGCLVKQFPVIYLGMPLSVKRPQRQDFMPLIDKLQSRNNARGGMHLVDWAIVTTPKSVGRMGVLDLTVQNTSLLLRWWWRLYDSQDSLWATICIRLHAKPTEEGGPLAWNITGSFFWAALHNIKWIFHWSTYWIVGNGRRINFWFDSWDGMPLFETSTRAQRPSNMVLSLRQGQSLLEEVAPDFNLQFTDMRDEIRWRWSSAGSYSSRSIYRIFMEGGKENFAFPKVWIVKIPPTVRIFGYFLLKRKLLTRDALRRRGMHCERGCVMCANEHEETILHLFYQCRYSRRVWAAVQASWGFKIYHFETILVPYRHSIVQIWSRSVAIYRQEGRGTLKDWVCKMLCTVWNIWKQRNKMIFRGSMVPAEILARRIIQEERMWFNLC